MSRLIRRWAALAPAILLWAGAGCNNQPVATPTRTLDRPSDVALYCADVEVPNCLPTIDPDENPQAYLDAYCDQSSLDFANFNQPKVTVLSMEECDDEHRRVRIDNYFAAVHRAAQAVGRDAHSPCCPPDNVTCGNPEPTCARRILSALITNTSRGELAVADTQTQAPGLSTLGRLENLHGGQPGYGFLPVGLMPEHVRSFSPATGTGVGGRTESALAWAATTNTGSCDLSVVDLQKIADLAAHPAICNQQDQQGQSCPTRSCTAESCPQRVVPWLPGPGGIQRQIAARPAWLEISPWAQGSRRSVVVSFPTCGVIASIDLGDATATSCDPQASCGRITDAVAFDASGKPRILTAADLNSLECAADCGGDTSSSLMPDPKSIPDGGVPPVSVFPASLAIDGPTGRIFIGNSVGQAITVVDFDPNASDGSRFVGSPRSIPLDFSVLPESLRGGQPGLDSIRITPRTPAGQFAYVVARDSSVRVLDLDREIECETNPDARYLQAHSGDFARILPDELNESNLRRLSCLPAGPGKTPRGPLATTPGIVLDNGSLPRDVGFVHVNAVPCDINDPLNCAAAPNADPSIWVPAQSRLWLGDFGWILGGGGIVTGVQIADACPTPSYRACFPDTAALKRLYFLHTRSQYLPAPEVLNLPSLYQALMVRPTDRLANVKRLNTRFEEHGLFGPRTESDGSGVPTFTARVNGTTVAYFGTLNDKKVPAGRRRLFAPTPTPYYYLPVDPVCDVALATHAQPSNFASPDGVLPNEPTRRPMSMVQFTDPSSLTDQMWTLDWEGILSGLSRSSGRLLPDGTLTDLNGLFCSRGVESRDKLWLGGCISDSDCLVGTTCHREATQGTTPGICLTNDQATSCRAVSQQLLVDTGNDTAWAATWQRRYRIVRAEQQVPATSGDITDRLTLDEIPEPEFEVERQSCSKLGSKDVCDKNILRPGRTYDASNPPNPTVACRGTGFSGGSLETSCVLECQTNLDCGDGFVCAHSHYEASEEAAGVTDARSRPRCMRAPLIHPQTPMKKGGTWQPMGTDGANALLAACFPDLIRYEVHGGDAFVVRGDRSGTPVLVQRAPDGSCRRPPPGDPAYVTSRLLEPRLRLGPRDSLADADPGRCPTSPTSWISHRIPAIPEAVGQPSCQAIRPGPGGVNTVQLLPPLNGTVDVVRGEDYPLTTKPQVDPWLASEYELFSGLPLDSGRNQCILSGAADETYPDADALMSCVGNCRFPGDHTENQGVRRIHYETAFGNIVLRVPRLPIDTTKDYSASIPVVWAVPPDGYSVSFAVAGTLTSYSIVAQTAQRDASSGLLAQGLRAATGAPSGALYLVDEGRSGALAGLRGQVLRIIGSQLDQVFLLR